MVVHVCKQEKEIGEISALIGRLVSQVYGNGQKGLATSVPELSNKIDNLSETITLLSTNVSAMMKFQNEMIGARNFEEKAGITSRQKAGIYISAILGTASIITALILKFL